MKQNRICDKKPIHPEIEKIEKIELGSIFAEKDE